MNYLIYFTGFPGTGKTKLSNLLKSVIKHSIVLRRNEIKKWIGDFTESEINEDLIYTLISGLSDVSLKKGYNVIIDGAGCRKKYQDELGKICLKNRAVMVSVRMICKLSTSFKRTKKRTRNYRWSIDELRDFKKNFERYPVDIVINSDIHNSYQALEKVCKKINLKNMIAMKKN